MSILIKGMEMPFSCLACPCSGTDNTDDGNEVWVCEASELRQLTVEDKIVRRPEWCPLVPVPYHGDLIDREAWKKSLIGKGETIGIDGFSIDGLSTDDVCYAIENAPVIIPAEREKGNWVYGENEYGIDGYRCDKCGFFVLWDYGHNFINYIGNYNFCPSCGADMRGEEDDT